ncbi:MAG TPA: glycosyltransferase [Candidatus Sulfotelmatobacter sp.]|jgi:D-inositol-3-phosphate glycosyltransferase|nr:glycosyltransferase [Candidatus Sulfotelmatobacter sp.]
MNTKRLAVISYHTCPISDEKDAEIGGMNIYVLELSKALAKKGYYIDIFTRSQDAKSPRIVQVNERLRVIHILAGPQEPLSKKVIEQYIPEFLKHFYEFIEKENIVYWSVSCHYFLSGIIGRDIKKKLGRPLIVTFHTLGLMKNLVARSDEERESKERIVTELQLVKEADLVIATGETDAQYIQYLYDGDPEKITVLTPGVDLNLFKPTDKITAKKIIGAATDKKLILFVGRIEPLKGIDVLLYALKILLGIHPNLKVCVWIVGGDISQDTDEWPKELKKLSEIRQLLGMNTSVKFIGRKEQQKLPNYYNAADLMVMPSHYESFGITAVEAMACGVPVITTDVSGVSKLIDKEHSILITSANNPIMLSDRITKLLCDDDEYAKMSYTVAENVRDLSWDKSADHFISLCKSCSKEIDSEF